MALFKCT